MLSLGTDTYEYGSHYCLLIHVVSLSIDRHCMELFQNVCMVHALPGEATANPFTTFYDDLHTTISTHPASELCLKMLVICDLELLHEVSQNTRIDGINLTNNPQFSAWEL